MDKKSIGLLCYKPVRFAALLLQCTSRTARGWGFVTGFRGERAAGAQTVTLLLKLYFSCRLCVFDFQGPGTDW